MNPSGRQNLDIIKLGTSEKERRKWISWPHVVAFLITAALLYLIFRKIPAGQLWSSLKRLNPFWFVGAFLVYGSALWFGACRWHLALHLTHRALHLMATFRLFLVGHFLYSVLFGAVGGDLAKSAVYARWFRFGLPEVLAAAPLDRVFGLVGSIAYGALAVFIAWRHNGFAVLRDFKLNIPQMYYWAAGILGVAVVLTFIFWRPKTESAMGRVLRAFKTGGARMAVSPRVIFPGIAFAMLGQLALTSIIALNLRAVTDVSLPWGQMIWTLPVIMIASAMPFTVAGAGAREIAALALLGLYGVPPADCIAASLLTLIHKLAWALIGGVIFWRNGARYAQMKDRPAPRAISAIIPTLNEASELPETIQRLRCIPEISEIIVVDGGSSDATREIAAQLGCRVLSSAPGRGRQLRLGAGAATGDIILLLRADAWLPSLAGQAALTCLHDPFVVAGGFWNRYRNPPLLLLGARLQCALRLMLFRRVAADQGIFVRRSALEKIGGVPDLPLIENFELCRRLRKIGHLALADATVLASARRFREFGVLKTILKLTRVSWLYRLRKAPASAKRFDEA